MRSSSLILLVFFGVLIASEESSFAGNRPNGFKVKRKKVKSESKKEERGKIRFRDLGYGNYVGPRCRKGQPPIGPIDAAAREHDEVGRIFWYDIPTISNPFKSSDVWKEDLRLAGRALIANPFKVGEGGTVGDRVVGNFVVRPIVVIYEGTMGSLKLVIESLKWMLGKGWLWGEKRVAWFKDRERRLRLATIRW